MHLLIGLCLLVCACLALQPSPFCGSTHGGIFLPGQTTASSLLTPDGVKRTFLVHLPPTYNPSTPLPILFVIHGAFSSGSQIEATTRFSALSDSTGQFIAVYPEGWTGQFGLRTWNAGNCCSSGKKQDDVQFIESLLLHLSQEELCVNLDRVFATGISNGGSMSYYLACNRASMLAGIAPVSGTITTSVCDHTADVPLMHTHGSDDHYTPFEGGIGRCLSRTMKYTFQGVQASLQLFQEGRGCQFDSSDTYLEEGNGICQKYRGCREGAETIMCRVEGSGHAWPLGQIQRRECQKDGPQSRTFDATKHIWDFFFSLPDRRSPPLLDEL